MCEHLNFRLNGKGFWGKCHCRQPDSGNPTVRDEKGACGNVGQRLEGEQLARSSRLRRGVYLKSTAQMLNWRSRAPYFYPTPIITRFIFTKSGPCSRKNQKWEKVCHKHKYQIEFALLLNRRLIRYENRNL